MKVTDKVSRLTPEQRMQIAARLTAANKRTNTAKETASLPQIQPDKQNWHEPFALNEIQEAYLVGRAEGIELGRHDSIVLAVPAWVARTLVPDLRVPTEYRSILNAHFASVAPKSLPKITGVINATTEWLFAFDGRLSVTISGAASPR